MRTSNPGQWRYIGVGRRKPREDAELDLRTGREGFL